MTAYVPGILDRLMGEEGAPAGRPGLEHLKDAIARDLEALLNTRAGAAFDAYDAHPRARASIVNYGLADFAGFCLSSSEDRTAICASLKDAIERHEPRLANVSAVLEPDAGSINRLQFVIHATLRAGAGTGEEAGAEPIDFNAVLQPSSLHYAISRPGRGKRS